MRIAILGTRGIPANYGGFETFAEQLSTRLAARGHQVTVYCRSHHIDKKLKDYGGAALRVLPTIRQKYLDTVVHMLLSAIDAAPRRFDAVLVCNAANAPFLPILTLSGTPVAINVDGLERNRKKWNFLGRLYYSIGERASVWFATEVVTDARVIQNYYRTRYGAESAMIAYGAEIARSCDAEAVREYGARPNRYFLYVSRLEPENNAAMVIEAFRAAKTDMNLVIVGDAPYADEYKRHLRTIAADDARIIFTGFVFGDGYKALQQNAYAYIHATEVGGTHPALIEAMGYGNCVLVYETDENCEVAGEAAIRFSDAASLTAKIEAVSSDDALLNQYRKRAQERVAAQYSWEKITDQYEELFLRIGRRR